MLNAFHELIDAASSDGDRLDDLDPEKAGQFVLIDENAAALCFIIHVEVKDKRHLHLGKLQRDEQAAPQVLRVSHLDDNARPVRNQHVARDLLVFRHRHEPKSALLPTFGLPINRILFRLESRKRSPSLEP
jgi:hypothetical protein